MATFLSNDIRHLTVTVPPTYIGLHFITVLLIVYLKQHALSCFIPYITLYITITLHFSQCSTIYFSQSHFADVWDTTGAFISEKALNYVRRTLFPLH